MRKALSIALVLVLGLSTSAWARPAGVSNTLNKVKYIDLNSKGGTGDYKGSVESGVFNSAAGGTTYYGGTTWGAAEGRWEAVIDSQWTFDTGMGSYIIGPGETGADWQGVTGSGFPWSKPLVNRYKISGLHALMEGWVGFDNTYSELTYLRLLDETAFPVGFSRVGASHWTEGGTLSGTKSWYCGTLAAEAAQLCWNNNKGGYGNSWAMCLGKRYTVDGNSDVTVQFTLAWDSEPGYDRTTFEVDTVGAAEPQGTDIVEVELYDGQGSASESFPLPRGDQLRSDAGDIVVRFCFTSDGGWSDEDGILPSDAGAFSVDDIGVSGGGISDGPYDFEDGLAHGWGQLPAEVGAGGEWSRLAHLQDLPDYLTPCVCDLQDSVLVFEDLTTGGHGLDQDNLAASPWIKLQAGADGPGKFIQTNLYAELPVVNYIFVQFNMQWYPDVCNKPPHATNLSPWTIDGFVYYFGGVPVCTSPPELGGIPTRIGFSPIVPANVRDVRIAIGMLNYCQFYSNCSGFTNHTPIFDKVSLGVFGTASAPYIGTRTIDSPQDNFPADGSLAPGEPVRLDANNVTTYPTPENGCVIGDTLVVEGGLGGASVYVNFKVYPGPFTDGTELSNWLGNFDTDGGWYTAKMDTAEIGDIPSNGFWMTAYHEDDTNFMGTPHPDGDNQIDTNDSDPAKPNTQHHLLNDMFRDDLFTPGTHVDLFYRTQYDTATTNAWFLLPDTTLGFIEWEALPSSVDLDSTWNCVLYVDHFDGRGAQPWIEHGLAQVLAGTGNNHEGTRWDRYDVRAPSSQQASFGRPLNTEFGATTTQALAYDAIVWNTGNLQGYNLVKEDADVIIPFLTLLEQPGHGFWTSGDGAITQIISEAASEPSAKTLMDTYLGVSTTGSCNTYREAGCPAGSVEDLVACINLDPVVGAPVAGQVGGRTGLESGQGNGCPQQRSFDVLALQTLQGSLSAAGDEFYNNSPTKTAEFSSIASVGPGPAGSGIPEYHGLVDGISVHYRRNTGDCLFASTDTSVVDLRVAEALNWLGYHASCTDLSKATDVPIRPVAPTWRTTLANFAPNPLLAGAQGKIAFTMEKEGRANIDIFDVNGRLVKTVFNGIAKAGPNEANWNGTDFTGREVASGVYFYRLRADRKDFSKKMVVVRNGGN